MYPWYQRTPMGHPEQVSAHQKPEKVRWNDLFTLENPDLDFRKTKLLRACSQNFDGIYSLRNVFMVSADPYASP